MTQFAAFYLIDIKWIIILLLLSIRLMNLINDTLSFQLGLNF